LNREILSSGEAGRLAGVGAWTIWHWHTAGRDGVKLPAQTVGGRLVVSRRDLQKFLRRRAGREFAAA
jgi:hypothetical protein